VSRALRGSWGGVAVARQVPFQERSSGACRRATEAANHERRCDGCLNTDDADDGRRRRKKKTTMLDDDDEHARAMHDDAQDCSSVAVTSRGGEHVGVRVGGAPQAEAEAQRR
jgi:hypothetical protein